GSARAPRRGRPPRRHSPRPKKGRPHSAVDQAFARPPDGGPMTLVEFVGKLTHAKKRAGTGYTAACPGTTTRRATPCPSARARRARSCCVASRLVGRARRGRARGGQPRSL